MMNFLENLKHDLEDGRLRRGSREKILVDGKSLNILIEQFERIDTAERALHPGAMENNVLEALHNAITAVYHQYNKEPQITLLEIMRTLHPLMEKDLKRKSRELEYQDLDYRRHRKDMEEKAISAFFVPNASKTSIKT